MILEWLLSIPWLEISWGFFISGIILTIIAVIGAIESGGVETGHEVDVSHDVDVGHDLDLSHDVDIGHDLDIGHDVDIGHDLDVSHDVDIGHDFDVSHDVGHGEYLEHGGTPLTLLLGAFLLIYGGFGIAIFQYYGVTLPNVLGLLGITVFAVFLISFMWKKIFTTGIYTWRAEYAIGKIATVMFTVDKDGGSIKVDTHTPLGIITYPARSLDPNKTYPSGELVYVVGFKDGYAIVSDSPLSRRKN